MDSLSTMLGLASALTWGAGDFFGGYASRKSNVFKVVAFSQSLGFLLLFFAAVVVGERLLDTVDLMWSCIAGACSGLGLVFYYAALARGSMGLAAPLTGVLTAAMPAAAGAFIEGLPSPIQVTGFILAFMSIALVTGDSGYRLTFNTQVLLAMLAGVSFGLFLTFIGQVSKGSYLYPLAVSRLFTVAIAITLTASLSIGPVSKTHHAPVIAAGIFDAGGSLFYLLARQAGRLDVAGVLSSLYPVSTVLLAKIVLREKLGKRRAVGIALATAATALINAST